MIGLGFNLRCKGDVGAGMGTRGRLSCLGEPSEMFDSLLSSPPAAVALLSAFSLSSFDSLFLPPIPAETSASTLSGSPFSFAFFESEPSSMIASSPFSELLSFFGESVFEADSLPAASGFDASSESAEAETVTWTPRVIGAGPGAVAGAGGLKSLR